MQKDAYAAQRGYTVTFVAAVCQYFSLQGFHMIVYIPTLENDNWYKCILLAKATTQSKIETGPVSVQLKLGNFFSFEWSQLVGLKNQNY